MIKEAIIWRESVYKNRFICKCGRKLADDNGNVNGDTLVAKYINDTEYLHCPKCKNAVAYITKIDAPENMSGLQGNIEDFKR